MGCIQMHMQEIIQPQGPDHAERDKVLVTSQVRELIQEEVIKTLLSSRCFSLKNSLVLRV